MFSWSDRSERLRAMPTTSANTTTKAIVAVLALGVAALLAFAPSAGAHSTTHRCGSVSGPTHGQAGGIAVNNIKAVNVSCKVAKSVALHWCDHNKAPKGWHESSNHSGGQVVFTKGKEKVSGYVAG
jgi:hypothetical protein